MDIKNRTTGNAELDYGLDWLCHKVGKVLDFGCGDGKMLNLCAARGTTTHIGIDKSPLLMHQARKAWEKYRCGSLRFYFRCGDVTEFRTLLPASVEAVILSGILDILEQKEIDVVLTEVHRILAKDGKVLVKLNDYLSDEGLAEMKMKRESNYFWRENTGDCKVNLPTKQWEDIFGRLFMVKEVRDVYYKDFDLQNRMFLLIKRQG